jgi:hypothetical protein
MEDSVVWIGDLIATLVYLTVGIKLWGLSRRTGEFPERLLGIAMILWGASFIVYDAPNLLVGNNHLGMGEEENFFPAISLASYVVSYAGNFGFAIFVLMVFRPGQRWALGLVALIASALVVGMVGSARMGDWELLGTNGSSFYWFARFGASTVTLWMGIEAIGQYIQSRRRKKLGLCSSLASNRFALLGITASLWIAMDVATIVQSLVVEQGVPEILAFFIQLEVIFDAFGASLLGLAFLPPAFYQRWVQRDESTEASVSL